MQDHQWRLLAPDGSVDLLFGTLDTGIQTSRAPDLGQRNLRTGAVPAPREDGVRFGPGYEEGTTIAFEADVLTADWATNSDKLNELRRAWGARTFRRDHDAYAELHVRAAGRERRCYGRPGRFAEADGDLTHAGLTPVVFDFTTYDGAFYAAEENIETVSIRPPTSRGFSTPIVVTGTDPNTVAFQTETLAAEDLPGNVTVDGDETWAWVEIHGPVTNPQIQLGDLTLALEDTIPDGDSVLLDPRPWSRRVIRVSDGANLAGRLTWDTPPMADWQLDPGSYELVFRGTDNTGTAYATVHWREAFDRP